MRTRRRLFAMLACAALAAAPAAAQADPGGNVVVSQVYGGGGNSGGLFDHDFIEVFNRGWGGFINVNGWAVQYASTTGSSWQVTPLPNVVVPPGGYLLVQEGSGNGMPAPGLPAPDVAGTIQMSSSAGKVALTSSTTPLQCPGGSCSLASVVDLVGYGTGTNLFEGSGPAPTLSNPTADRRAHYGCTDTDQNATDFTAAAPTPRNSSTPILNCADSTPPHTTLTAAPPAPNGSSGWYTSTPTVSATAVEPPDTPLLPSGVESTRCALDPGFVPSGFADLVAIGAPDTCPAILADGIHDFYAASVDRVGNEESPAAAKTVKLDTVKPDLHLPGPITVDATGPGGAAVSFTATATDATSGPATQSATCAPPSGATFPINGAGATTTVNCSATDVAGNTGTGSLLVHVKGVGEQLADLTAFVNGLSYSARGMLLPDLALAKLDPTRCTALALFLRHVGILRLIGAVTPVQATALTDAAMRIRNVAGCA